MPLLSHVRFYADDAAPGSASPLAAEDAPLTAVQPNAALLVRLQTLCQSAAQVARRLEVRPAGDTWVQVSSAGGGTPLVMAPSSWLADASPVGSARLTEPAGATFVPGQARDLGSETEPDSFGANVFTEDVFALRVAGGIASLGATYELRLTNAGAPYEEYDVAPSLTISEVASPSVMDVKANQRFGDRRPLAKLEYERNGAWHDLSDRLLFPVKLHRKLRAAATAELLLDNSDGMLARGNLASALNYDASSTYDPLLDENRTIRLHQGWALHPNLLLGRSYTTSPAPAEGSADPQGVRLTDGHFGPVVGWTPPADQPVTIVCTLAAPTTIKGAALSAISCTNSAIFLPTSAAAFLHTAAGTLGPLAMPVAHLADDPGGKAQRLLGLDWDVASVHAVAFQLGVQSGGTVALDEIAAYDASTTVDWHRPTFTGLLGDEIAFASDARGVVRLSQVRDTTKRLGDCFVESYRHYRHDTVEQILGDLLVNSYYGLRLSEGEFRLSTTSFTMPKWSEQNASMLDACAQLAQMVGFVFEADAAGVYDFHDLEWDTQTGDEAYLPEHDLLGWQPTVSGLNLRNRVTIRSRDARQRDIAVTIADDESVERYGARLFTLYEPTMRTAPLARQLARAILRDYSWVQTAGAGEIAGDVFLRPGDIVSVVESAAVFSRAEQLYRIEGISATQTGQRFGDHTMVIELAGYRPRVPDAVSSLTATPLDSGVRLSWVDLDDSRVTHYAAYRAGSYGGDFTQVGSTARSPIVLDGLTNGVEYWFKVAGFTSDGRRGDYAGPLPCTPTSGGPPVNAEDAYQPQSLTVTRGLYHRPELRWYPGSLGGEKGALFNIYRTTEAPTGSWLTIGSQEMSDSLPVLWRDSTTTPTSVTLYYRVTYWNRSGFESAPSSWASL